MNLQDSTAHQKDVYNVFAGVRVFVSIVGPLSFITFPGDAWPLSYLDNHPTSVIFPEELS